MKNRYVLLGSALALALPLSAQAETQGYYIGGAAGADFAVDSTASGGGHSGTVRYDVGPTGSLSAGYGFGAIRAEVEGTYLSNDVSGVGGAGLSNPGGYARTWGFLVNGFYDINTGTPFTPYLGVGIGAGFVHASLTSSNKGTIYDGDDTTFAYQGIAGVSYAVTPQLSLTADYRYLATTDATVKSGSTSWNVQNANHIITAGFRWALQGPPQPMMVPAAVVTPQTDFVVYFNWDKYNIDAEAQAVIANAAAAARQVNATVILVTGNTDTTGSNPYNQALSERRAEAVKQALLQQGLSPNLIQTVGKGKTELAVPTPDEVKERLNRRAQIVIRVG